MERFLATALATDLGFAYRFAEDFAARRGAGRRSLPEFAEELEHVRQTAGSRRSVNRSRRRRAPAPTARVEQTVLRAQQFCSPNFALAERKHDFLSESDDCVISGHVGFVKPDASMYEILFKRGAGPKRARSSTICPPT